MDKYEHLSLPKYQGDIQRKPGGHPRIRSVVGRTKRDFADENIKRLTIISDDLQRIKASFGNKIDPKLIFRFKINQEALRDIDIEDKFDVTVISVGKKDEYWIAFSDKGELEKLKKRLKSYGEEQHKYYEFEAIDIFEDIPIEDKIGSKLRENPLSEDKLEYLDIEFWPTSIDDIKKCIQGLKEYYDGNDKFEILDEFITRNIAKIRVKAGIDEINHILELKRIFRIDRPSKPTINIYELTRIDIEDIDIQEPQEGAVGILIIDSGITSGHPLLKNCVGYEEDYQNVEDSVADSVGHGTAVGGNAVYGDIAECLQSRSFKPSNYLYSAKVMYGEPDSHDILVPVYNPKRLLEHQLSDAIHDFCDNESYRIKVVNLSLGCYDEVWNEESRHQFPLAQLIDDLAFSHPQVVFLVSAGNCDPNCLYSTVEGIEGNYPDYLFNNNFRIINPGTSALSLTIGSLAHKDVAIEQNNNPRDIWTPIANANEPSPFTRCGPGVNKMVKPELVEHGGNLICNQLPNTNTRRDSISGKLILLSNDPTKLFGTNYGTSFSTPKVAHMLGLISNKYPNGSANFLKNLLLQSSRYPNSLFNNDIKKNLKTMGYGLPNLDKALYSFDNRILLFYEGELGLNKFDVFEIPFPEEFISIEGTRKLSIALTFNPPVNRNRQDSYLGNKMKFYLFHGQNPEIVSNLYSGVNIETETEDEIIPETLKRYRMGTPGGSFWGNGCHQKGLFIKKRGITYNSNPITSPFTLVVINQKKWIRDESYKQPYCVSIVLEHSEEINIYNSIRTQIQERVRIRP